MEWRKTYNNYAKGSKIINISPKYKVNTTVGYNVYLYDFKIRGSLSQQRRILKTFKTKLEAVAYRKRYMNTH